MKIINKYLPYFLLFILILVASIWFSIEKDRFNRLYEEKKLNYNEMNILKTVLKEKNQIFLLNHIYSNKDFFEIPLRDLDNNLLNSNEFLIDEGVLIFAYFDSKMCATCLDREWNNFFYLSSEYKNSIFLISKGFPIKYFKIEEKFQVMHNNIFISTEEIYQNSESPIYFLLVNGKLFAFQTEKNTNDTFILLKNILEIY
jgi:hypothetical protein